MEYAFSFSLLCHLHKDKKMVTQSIDAAKIIAKSVSSTLNTMSTIMKPHANYSFMHVRNNKDHQYDYIINISVCDRVEIDYQSIAELVFILYNRTIRSVFANDIVHIQMEDGDISFIEKICKRNLTDKEIITISSQLASAQKSLLRLTNSLAISIYRGDQTSSDFTLTDDPTKSSKRSKKLIDHVDDDHIERLARTKIKFQAAINIKSGNLNLVPYLPNNKRIYLSYITLDVYGKLVSIINDYECFWVDVLLDVNAHVDGNKYVHDVFPPEDTK